MVRIWEPSILPYLDDNRILAAHAEAHYIEAALQRGHGIWYRHPETVRFNKPGYSALELLRKVHALALSELELRAYNHRTPMLGYTASLEELLDAGASDCFDQPFEWANQDKADLFRKWNTEQRWRISLLPTGKFGRFLDAGAMVVKQDAERHVSFRPPRRPTVLQPDYDAYAALAGIYPHREWTQYDRLRLRLRLDASAT